MKQADFEAAQKHKETKELGNISYGVHSTYFKAGTSILGFLIFLLLNCSAQVNINPLEAKWSFIVVYQPLN